MGSWLCTGVCWSREDGGTGEGKRGLAVISGGAPSGPPGWLVGEQTTGEVPMGGKVIAVAEVVVMVIGGRVE